MKKILVLAGLILLSAVTFACPLCEQQQPKILRGITHGGGPDSNWDYLIISVALAIVVFTLFFSVKWLIKPGEKSTSHIKNLVLNYE